VFKWGNLHTLLHTIADDTLMCKDMNTKSLRNVVNPLMEGKLYLNTQLKWKWTIVIFLLCMPKGQTLFFSFDEQSTTRITQAKVLI